MRYHRLDDELELERRAALISEGFVKVKGVHPGSWNLGQVRITHCKTENTEFYRIQFRKIARYNNCLWCEQQEKFNSVKDSVQIRVDFKNRVAKFGPKGNIVARDPGLGIGSYLMAKVIAWAKKHYPDCEVLPGELSSVDARRDPDNKERRNKFYRKRGFELEFHDPENESGKFWADRIDQLNELWDTDKVTEMTLEKVISMWAADSQQIDKLRLANEACFKTVGRMNARFEQQRNWFIAALLVGIVLLFLLRWV